MKRLRIRDDFLATSSYKDGFIKINLNQNKNFITKARNFLKHEKEHFFFRDFVLSRFRDCVKIIAVKLHKNEALKKKIGEKENETGSINGRTRV